MRAKLIGVLSALFVSLAAAAGAQTPTSTVPTPTVGPQPTPTPPAPIYLSDPTIVNTDTTSNQRRPSVAVGADGNYLIVWNSDAAQLGYYDIKGQLFTHDGVKIGGEFQVDQAGANRVQYTPDIAADGLGNYVVVWADFNQTVTDSEIWARRYDGAANPLGGAVQVNTYTTAKQRIPRVAADSIGQFVVVWESEGQDGSGLGVFGQQFDETGAPVGSEFAVNNTGTTGDQDRPAVDMDDLGFTVAFGDGNGGIAAREFGTFATEGSSQFPVFGPNHRFADVARLDGASNTFYVAENTSTGGIDGVRTENSVPQTVFPIAQDGFGPRLSHAPMVFPLSSGPQSGPGQRTALVYASPLGMLAALFDLDPGEFPEFFEAVDQPVPVLNGVNPGDIGIGGDGQLVVTAADTSASGSDVYHGRGGAPRPTPIDPPLGLFEPSQSTSFSPALFNGGLTALGVLGDLVMVVPTLQLGPTLGTVDDSTADYGTIPAGATQDCSATGDCYAVTMTGPRPGVHWDEAVVETLSTGVHKTWILHVGSSFADVPTTNLFYKFIENLLHNGVTGGGACGGYCPTDGVKRQQMAVFLLKSRFGPSFTPPPATGTIFTDVTLANPFAAWIEALYLLGITGGCSGGPPPAPTQFCPDAIVNRQQMAVFLLKTLEGSAYVPPDAAGIFQDVPLTNPFVKWIEELYARQVTGGCVANPLQYCPTNPTNRQQMAAFLVKTFGLLLYGP